MLSIRVNSGHPLNEFSGASTFKLSKFKLRTIAGLVVCAFLLLTNVAATLAQDEAPAVPEVQRPASLIEVALPVTSASARFVEQALARALEKTPDAFRPENRPVVVLEFDISNGKTGQGSDFEACQKIARQLISAEMTRLNVIAYIPAPRGYVDPDAGGINNGMVGQLNGAAVLIALAADEIAMHPDTAIGRADIDEPGNQMMVELFGIVAKQRISLPLPMAMSMVDANAELSRVLTDDGYVFTDAAMKQEIAEAGDEISSATLSTPGQSVLLTSDQLKEFRLIDLQAESRTELERKLNVPVHSLDGDPTLGKSWKAVQINIPPYLEDRDAQWIMRALDAGSPNLIVFRIDSAGGNTDACLKLASRIANYDPGEIRTVAFVEGQARGPVAVLALFCDHLVMTPDSVLGGPSDPPLEPETISAAMPTILNLAEAKGRDWSMFAAAMDPSIVVRPYSNRETGQSRVLSEEELEQLDDPAVWDELDQLGMDEGITANKAEQLFIARALADNTDALQSFYQLESEPVSLEPTLADRWLEDAAAFLASPFVAPWLLFGAVFFLSTEMSAPGIGVPGFLGTLCLVLFFWSQFLEGNAHVLEILLFIVGVAFVLMEIFLLPGVGIFGIGGVIMVIVAIVLASQTFIIPKTAEQIERLPVSLSMVLAAGMGFIAAAVVLRRVLPNTPYLKRLMLNPPKKGDETGLTGGDSEAMVDWSHLEGRTGETISRCNPGGKARINGEVFDVITQGLMIGKGEPVEVVRVLGNRVEVRPVDG